MNIEQFFLIYFCLASSAPIHKAKSEDNGQPSAKKMCVPSDCYFTIMRSTAFETKIRPERSKVSTDCSDDLIRMGTFLNVKADGNTNAENQLSLILCRGIGECDVDFTDPQVVKKWKDVFICGQHADELVRQWDGVIMKTKHIDLINRKTEVCSMPEGVGEKHNKKVHTNLKTLTIQESNAILKQQGYLVHPGIRKFFCEPHKTCVSAVCRSHKEFSAKMIEYHSRTPSQRTNIKPHYVTEDGFNDENVEECERDPDFYPEKFPKTRTFVAFMEFAKRVGVDRTCSRVPFSELAQRTQQKKTCAAKKLFDVIIENMAPNDAEELKTMTLAKIEGKNEWTSGNTKPLHEILTEVANQYYASEDKLNKLYALSTVANSISLSELHKYIPDLSQYYYYEAIRFSRQDRKIIIPDRKLERFSKEKVLRFVEFLASPIVLIGLPWGTIKGKLSDGTKIEIPNTIRQQSHTEIIRMYEKYMKENKEENNLLSVSSMYRILETCSASKREASSCVDYFVADGKEAFEKLALIVDNWSLENLIDSQTKKTLGKKLLESQQYLNTDFRLHVKNFSRVADHCSTFALSNPKLNEQATDCSDSKHKHKHDLKCDRCELVKNTLNEIEQIAHQLVEDSKNNENSPTSSGSSQGTVERREEEVVLIRKHIEKIMEMKKHLLRATYTDEERSKIIHKLHNNEAFLCLDFAQKYLPHMYREPQRDYFGKKGISWHITHVTARVKGQLVQHSFVHIYSQDVPQDSNVVTLTLKHVAKELKKVGINNLHLRSDNAAAYHCALTISAVNEIQKTEKIKISSYTFSEAQNGKSSSDREASRVKTKSEIYVDKGRDITTSDQFYQALQDGKMLSGISLHDGTIEIKNIGSPKWPGITSINHFSFETNGVIGRSYGGIGKGIFVPYSDLTATTGEYSFESAGFIADGIISIDDEQQKVADKQQTNFWYFTNCNKKTTSSCPVEHDKLTPIINEAHTRNSDAKKLFSCPAPGCSSAFLRYSNLEKHVLRNKHRKTPEKVTMRDLALQSFIGKIEEVDGARVCPIVQNAIEELKETDGNPGMAQGWALREKQQKKAFTSDVIKYLTELFDDGIAKKMKHNPRTVSKMMEVAKNADGTLRFKVEERKDYRQIAAFFSRLSSKRKTTGSKSRQARATSGEQEESSDTDESHEDAAWIEFMKEGEFLDEFDEIYKKIIQNVNSIFTDYHP